MPVNYGYLNNEEYKALRKVLGFSQAEAQEFHGLKNIRTINQWESGRNNTSECACNKMTKYSKLMFEHIKDKFFEFRQHRSQPAILLSYKEDETAENIKPVLEFFPCLSVYKMTIYRAYVEAMNRGFDAHIITFDAKLYKSYLQALDLEDNLKTREDWARYHYLKFKR